MDAISWACATCQASNPVTAATCHQCGAEAPCNGCHPFAIHSPRVCERCQARAVSWTCERCQAPNPFSAATCHNCQAGAPCRLCGWDAPDSPYTCPACLARLATKGIEADDVAAERAFLTLGTSLNVSDRVIMPPEPPFSTLGELGRALYDLDNLHFQAGAMPGGRAPNPPPEAKERIEELERRLNFTPHLKELADWIKSKGWRYLKRDSLEKVSYFLCEHFRMTPEELDRMTLAEVVAALKVADAPDSAPHVAVPETPKAPEAPRIDKWADSLKRDRKGASSQWKLLEGLSTSECVTYKNAKELYHRDTDVSDDAVRQNVSRINGWLARRGAPFRLKCNGGERRIEVTYHVD